MKKRYTLMTVGLLAISFSGTILTGCVEQSPSQSKSIQKAKTTWVDKLKKLATQKQTLTENLWRLQNTKIIALNQGNFKTLHQIKKPLFETQTKLDNVTNEMATWNKVLRHHYHHAVLDNGQEINTWTLLKTDGQLLGTKVPSL